MTKTTFTLPDRILSTLPTGAVKDIVDILGSQIACGAHAPGRTLPHEADLAEQMGVSRTVLREAIKVLQGLGMVRTARRYGTHVCGFDDWNLLDPDVIRWHSPDSPMASRIYNESTELRCMIEPEAAALAAVHASELQRKTILDAARAIHPDCGGEMAMIAADFTFHATILKATGNIMLSQFQGLILALLQFSYPTGARTVPDEKVSRQNHVAVAEAIFSGDPDRARNLMQIMLDQNRKVARKMAVAARA